MQRVSVLALLAFGCALILWLWLFVSAGPLRPGPGGKAFGADLAMFLSATDLMRHGLNPYNPALLYRHEILAMQAEHLTLPTTKTVVRVGNPPLFLWALQPLTFLSFQLAGWLWTAFLSLASCIGIWSTLAFAGWRRPILAGVATLAMPQVVVGVYYGNPIALIFCAMGMGLWSLQRYPAAAGLLLSAGWVKPPVALPFVLLILLFHAPNWRRTLAGFCGGTLALALATFLFTAPRLTIEWLQGMAGYGGYTHLSPNIASLSGAFAPIAEGSVRFVLSATLILAALTCTAWVWKSGKLQRYAYVLWFVWFLATPYAHFYDEIMLLAPTAMLLRAYRGGWPARSLLAIYLMLLSLTLFSWTPGGMQLLWLPIMLCSACLLPPRTEKLQLERAA